MDTLKLIRDQIENIAKYDSELNLGSIIIHLERAEIYYAEGKSNGDDHLFNDVIYRTNQAFEGSLKEAFKVLADKANKKEIRHSLISIENFFEEEEIFNPRVLNFFRNYRQEWRNKSTHDSNLFFNQHEAFLAINGVTAYIHLLLDQIIGKLAFENEKRRLRILESTKETIRRVINNGKLTLDEKIIELIKEFSLSNQDLKKYKELEIIEMFRAFVEEISPKLNVETEVLSLVDSSQFRFDVLISDENEKIIIEIKRPNISKQSSHIHQVEAYLSATGINQGILWYPSLVTSANLLEIETHTIAHRQIKYITVIQSALDRF